MIASHTKIRRVQPVEATERCKIAYVRSRGRAGGARLEQAVDLNAGLRAAGQRALGALARRLQPAQGTATGYGLTSSFVQPCLIAPDVIRF